MMYDDMVNKKIVKQLTQKKFRNELGLFLVEGRKSVDELLASDFEIAHIFCTREYLHTRPATNSNLYTVLTQSELESLGTLEENDSVLAVVKKRVVSESAYEPAFQGGAPVLYLDAIRDPGNLGTIIRSADWFGIQTLFVSPDTVDCYNAKVIAATMGSFTRVSVIERTHAEVVALAEKYGFEIAALVLSGNSIYEAPLKNNTLFIMGSESHGVSGALLSHATCMLTIPSWGTAESLNVSIATAITLSEYRRRFP